MADRPPPHLDCPPCPGCSSPCGSLEGGEVPRGCLRCGACGHEWRASLDELAQAERADRAYAREREIEARDEATLGRMPEHLRRRNAELLARPRQREGADGHQLELLGRWTP